MELSSMYNFLHNNSYNPPQICSPACTELEVVVMDWLAKFLKLPAHFQHASDGPGGGVIQGSASEAVLVAVLAAREQAVANYRESHPELSESEVRGRLVAYSSDQSNSCIEKAGVLAAMPIRLLPAGEDFVLRGDTLRGAIEEDVAALLLVGIPSICRAASLFIFLAVQTVVSPFYFAHFFTLFPDCASF